MVKIKLPGVDGDFDRHGNFRYYLRANKAKGWGKVRIRGTPGTEEFSASHAAAIASRATAKSEPTIVVSKSSFQFLSDAYIASIDFKTKYSLGSQQWRIAMLRGLCKTIGAMPAAKLEQDHIMTWMDARADRPEAANNLVKCLRGLFKFAKERKIVTVDPTLGIKKIQTYSEGFHTWTVPEVLQYFDAHAPGSKARMAICIALFSGLRRQDVAILGRQHIGPDGKIRFKGAAKSRRKKNKDLALPILPDLKAEMDAVPPGQLTFLLSEHKKPFTAASLGNKFREWCDEANLPHCTMHGLRKAGATIAANNGASDTQLMAIYGWVKADMATLYTEKRDREKLAEDGMQHLHFERPENAKVSHLETTDLPPMKKASK